MTGRADHATAAELDARAQHLARALEDALRERNELWAQLQRHTARERELEQMQLVLADIQSSLSWRLTAPLRLAKRLSNPTLVVDAIQRLSLIHI